ncbi:helix-turn-helix domain-containing protein [Gardnerella vaginalis]
MLLAGQRRTQNELAEVLDMTRPSVNMRLNEATPWRVPEIEKAAEFLKVEPTTLFVAGHGFEPWTSGL